MKKLNALERAIGARDRFILAFSGGLDSTFLALYLKRLGKEFIAVTVDNGMLPDLDCIKEEAERHELSEGGRALLFGNMKDLYKDTVSTFTFPTYGDV